MSEHLQRHHLFWPRKKYKTKMEKRFRNLPCNIRMLNAQDHRAEHAKYPNGNPGGKPSREAMIQAIHNHEQERCTCTLTTRTGERQRG